MLCVLMRDDLCALEPLLIQQWETLAPSGFHNLYRLAARDAVSGSSRAPKSVATRSAAKHRGKPCHPNTRQAAKDRKGHRNSETHNERIATAKRGVGRPEQTKA